MKHETVPAIGGGTVTAYSFSTRIPKFSRGPPVLRVSFRRLVSRTPRSSNCPARTSHAALILPPLGDGDEPLRAPSMCTYSHLRDPSEVPTPPLDHSPPRRAVSPPSVHTHSLPTPPSPPSTDVLPPAHGHGLAR